MAAQENPFAAFYNLLIYNKQLLAPYFNLIAKNKQLLAYSNNVKGYTD